MKKIEITQEITVNGCKVILNFMPESNGKTIENVKRILISSQYRSVPSKTV